MSYFYNGISYPTQKEMYAARRRHYVELVEGGMNFTQAAKAVGVSKRTGKVWRNGRTRATGRNERPCAEWHNRLMDTAKIISGRFLSQDERVLIADMLLAGDSVRSIASALGRAPSTVSREIKSNADPATGRYCPHRAHEISRGRLARTKPRKVLDSPALRAAVQEKLGIHWSPEQISHWLSAEHPDNEGMNACPETIYQSIYVQAEGSLKRDVQAQLRSGRTRRKPHKREDARTPRFREPMINISERPPEVEGRAIPGHWEGDLIVGANNKTAIGTLVERSTRFCILLYLPSGHASIEAQEAIVRKMRHLPKLMRNSLTWDQGSELALHSKIGAALDMDVHFCDPHSPWQRGTNENTNGLLGRYFPKGTDLSIYPEGHLDAVAEELNDRPRKTLGWKKPSEEFVRLIEESNAA